MVWRRALLHNLLMKRGLHLKMGKNGHCSTKSISKASTQLIEIGEGSSSFSSILDLKKMTSRTRQAWNASGARLKRKREGHDRDEHGHGPIGKRSKAESRTDGRRVDSTDMISQLPKDIIHQILSFLRSPKDLTRVSILSKRWRELYSSFFVLNLDQRKFSKREEKNHFSSQSDYLKSADESQEFKDIVGRALLNCQEREVPIHKLMLHMTSLGSGIIHNVEKLLSFATGNKIKELDLHFPVVKSKKNRRYYLPGMIFTSSTLTSLRLFGCKLGAYKEISLPNLKKVSLGKLYVNECIIENLMTNCPLIEDLRLIYCTGLKKLLVSGLPNLSKLEVHYCRELTRIQVEVPSLETFWYRGKILPYQLSACDIDLSSCASLKTLTLEKANMTDESFKELLCNFPLLELLELSKCDCLKNIIIVSEAMKRLVVTGCRNLENVDVSAPNLLSFEFKGNSKPSLLLDPKSLREAKLVFQTRKEANKCSCPGDADLTWSAKLLALLCRFDQKSGMKLIIRCNKSVIIHEDLTEILLPPLSTVEIEVIRSSSVYGDMLDNVLNTWHPESISVVSCTDSPLLKLMSGIMERGDEQPSCCAYNVSNNKCWRHFLKGFETEELEVASYLKSSQTRLKRTTSFRLSWMSRQHRAKR